jgi:tRNA pseudouridine38-40 synthase
VVGSGRTDAGVHALGQVASFQADTRLASGELRAALNAHTPHDIRAIDLDEAAPTFHALRDATSKRYRYVIRDAAAPDTFTRGYAWHLRRALNERAMVAAAEQLIGRHDFACFQAAGSPRASTVRNVTDLRVTRCGEHLLGPFDPRRLTIEIEADGFLYNMVRNIAGTLVEVGQGRRSANRISELLASRDRKKAGPTAPAHGLFLVFVHYDEPHRGTEGEAD